MRRRAITALATYFLATGAWPILHMKSFEAITGPKVDRWLVKMVAALALANGAALSFGLRRDEITRETIALAVTARSHSVRST